MAGVLFVRICVMSYVAFLYCIMATEVIPERIELYYVNEKYFSNVTAYVRRTGRKSPYYMHGVGTLLATFGENVTIHGVCYEFLHNEYKRSFVQADLNLCDFKKEPWYTLIGKSLMAKGLDCPVKPGTYRFLNVQISMTNLPYVWPYEKAMIQVYGKLTTTDEIIAGIRIYATFMREVSKGKL